MKLNDFVIDSGYDSMLRFDDFDEAVIGICSCPGQEDKLIYDFEKMVEVLKTRDNMHEVDAVEYLEFNTVCAYMGELTPVIVRHKPEEPITDE